MFQNVGSFEKPLEPGGISSTPRRSHVPAECPIHEPSCSPTSNARLVCWHIGGCLSRAETKPGNDDGQDAGTLDPAPAMRIERVQRVRSQRLVPKHIRRPPQPYHHFACGRFPQPLQTCGRSGSYDHRPHQKDLDRADADTRRPGPHPIPSGTLQIAGVGHGRFPLVFWPADSRSGRWTRREASGGAISWSVSQ